MCYKLVLKGKVIFLGEVWDKSLKYCIANLSKITPNFPHYWTVKPNSINIKDITVQVPEKETPSWLNYSYSCNTRSSICMEWAVRFRFLLEVSALAHRQTTSHFSHKRKATWQNPSEVDLFICYALQFLGWFALIVEVS